MILHIPHASAAIAPGVRSQFLLSDAELAAESSRLVDAWTDVLFEYEGATRVVFGCNRLVVDVERFRNDEQEERASVGMGAIYTRTTGGDALRRPLAAGERRALLALYDDHHGRLERAVEAELRARGRCLIVDCHSFPSVPLPCDRDQSRPRLDICIGVDGFHTAGALVDSAVDWATAGGYSIAIDSPFAGTMVPMRWYRRDSRVQSIMVEANRRLYMDEVTGERLDGFDSVAARVGDLLGLLAANHMK